MTDFGERTLGPLPAPGDRVGGYRIEAAIGMGATATVFRALDERGAPVALKVLNPARVLPEDVKRFTREYRALARMDHCNVVAVYQAGVHQGYPWIAMEHVDGTDLGTLIDRWNESPPPDRFDRAERILRGLCRGLQYIHDLGLIHRDLKPSNVLITREGEAKLTDFGVVKAESQSTTHHTQLTMAGRLVGTVAFMAPELITEEGVDRRADLYALGAVLYVMLTGRRPIEARSVAGYLARHLTEVPRPAGEIDPSVPRHLERVAQRLLLKDKTYRYPTAQAVLQALDRGDHEPAPLRGRDVELSRWSELLVALADGVGGALAVLAPPGGGRTRFLAALLDQVHGADVLVLKGRGGLPLASQLLGADVPDPYAALTARLTHRRALVAVDDADRASPVELELLGRLLRERVAIEADPLLLVLTASEPGLREAGAALAGLLSGEATGLPCETLHLGPLDVKSTIAMMRDRGVAGPAAPLLGRRLHEDYGGQPGPMVEQLDALVAGGWFERVGDSLKTACALDVLRRAELPVPAAAAARLEQRLGGLSPTETRLVQLLAVMDATVPAGLLERCARDLSDVPRQVDDLVRRGFLDRAVAEGQEVLGFADPCMARVVRARLSPEERRQRHASVAQALSARRRSSSLDVAHHREQAGEPAAAYPLYVTAARRAARQEAFAEVLEITARAERVREQVEGELPVGEAVRCRRWLWMLRGEALLARGQAEEAGEVLWKAVSAAREEGDPQALARCLAGAGRALHRLGRFEDAGTLLEEALTHEDVGGPAEDWVRMAALRALADIRLRQGRLAASEELWQEALALAVRNVSRDAEARARRGLAHLRGIQGRLQESGELLDQAEELLSTSGDARVRSGVLARSIEIDTAAGRYGSALRKAELLVDIVRRRGLTERLPEAYALLAETLAAVGDHAEAHDAAQQALVFLKAQAGEQGGRPWDARLRAARVLCKIGRPAEAHAALPLAEDVPQHMIDDPAAQLAVLRARLYSQDNPLRARDLAAWALTREPPLMALRAARIALDAAIALTASGQAQQARQAVKRGLRALHGPGADGLRLELLLAMQAAVPEDRVLLAAGQVARRIALSLSPQLAVSFRARPAVAEALHRVES